MSSHFNPEDTRKYNFSLTPQSNWSCETCALLTDNETDMWIHLAEHLAVERNFKDSESSDKSGENPSIDNNNSKKLDGENQENLEPDVRKNPERNARKLRKFSAADFGETCDGDSDVDYEPKYDPSSNDKVIKEDGDDESETDHKETRKGNKKRTNLESKVKWVALRKKVPNVLSRCHTKRRKGTRGRARPSFGMTPTF